MLKFKENIYKSRRDLLPTGLCKELLGFIYKGAGDFVIQYKLCGDSSYTQYTFVGLPGNGGMEAYFDVSTVFSNGLCVQENTVTKISGGSGIVFNPDYGVICT